MSSSWPKIEFQVDDKIVASRFVRGKDQLESAIKIYQIASKAIKKQWTIFLYVPSRMNQSSGKNYDTEIVGIKSTGRRIFDIYELQRLRQCAYTFRNIAKQLFSNEACII